MLITEIRKALRDRIIHAVEDEGPVTWEVAIDLLAELGRFAALEHRIAVGQTPKEAAALADELERHLADVLCLADCQVYGKDDSLDVVASVEKLAKRARLAEEELKKIGRVLTEAGIPVVGHPLAGVLPRTKALAEREKATGDMLDVRNHRNKQLEEEVADLRRGIPGVGSQTTLRGD